MSSVTEGMQEGWEVKKVTKTRSRRGRIREGSEYRRIRKAWSFKIAWHLGPELEWGHTQVEAERWLSGELCGESGDE